MKSLVTDAIVDLAYKAHAAAVLVSKAAVAAAPMVSSARAASDRWSGEAAMRFLSWVCNGRPDSYLAALVVASMMRDEVPEGLPLGYASATECELRLFIQPRVSGPRLEVECRGCGRRQSFATAEEFSRSELAVACPIRTVMNS